MKYETKTRVARRCTPDALKTWFFRPRTLSLALFFFFWNVIRFCCWFFKSCGFCYFLWFRRKIVHFAHTTFLNSHSARYTILGARSFLRAGCSPFFRWLVVVVVVVVFFFFCKCVGVAIEPLVYWLTLGLFSRVFPTEKLVRLHYVVWNGRIIFWWWN